MLRVQQISYICPDPQGSTNISRRRGSKNISRLKYIEAGVSWRVGGGSLNMSNISRILKKVLAPYIFKLIIRRVPEDLSGFKQFGF